MAPTTPIRSRSAAAKLPSGSKLSIYNRQLLLSTGVPSLDELLGGGQSIGTVILAREDQSGAYARLLVKYYLSQSLATRDGNHALLGEDGACPATVDGIYKEWFLGWQGMPRESAEPPKNSSPSTAAAMLHDEPDESLAESSESNERMKIAWRYAKNERMYAQENKNSGASLGSRTITPLVSSFQRTSLRTYGSASSSNHNKPESSSAVAPSQSQESSSPAPAPVSTEPDPFCRQFDLQLSVCEKLVAEARDRLLSVHADTYAALFDQIRKHVESKFTSSTPTPVDGSCRPVLRIALPSLGSIGWNGDERELYEFMHALRGLVRYSFTACMITIPFGVFPEQVCQRLYRLADTVVELRAFTNADPPCYSKDYHGLFRVVKLPRVNELLAPNQRNTEARNMMAFKCRRRKFCIETLHLPPDVEEQQENASSGEAVKKSKAVAATGGCSSAGGSGGGGRAAQGTTEDW